ncbi:MAG: CopG family transcriptional regulator [Cryomorphaceae bacterium]|nr:MAG: CopG family transcriptional regulator [Cryomorphaceae bacterium]
MSTFTTSLPDDLLQLLAEHAQKLSVPKNALIEKALRIYLDQLTRAEYIQSYKRAAQDEDVMKIAEEGMEDYFRQLENADQPK